MKESDYCYPLGYVPCCKGIAAAYCKAPVLFY